MGIYDRDHRQNDPWKKNINNTISDDFFKYSESKSEIEFDQDVILDSPQNHLRNPKIINRRIFYKSIGREVDEDVHNFHQTTKALRKEKELMGASNDDEPKRKTFSFIPWIIAISIILILFKVLNKYSANEQSTNASQQIIEQSSSLVEPISATETLPTPLTSVLSTTYDENTSTCPLTIIANGSNYYVKLFATSDNKTIASFFIRAGETLQTKIPAGQYAVKYGSGYEWKGEQELFGQYGQYGRSEALAFYYDGFSWQGHTISLYKSTNGNFQTSNVDRDYVLQN